MVGTVNETTPRKPKWGEGGRQRIWPLDSEAIRARTNPGEGIVSARESESRALRKSDIQAEAGSRRGSWWPKGGVEFQGCSGPRGGERGPWSSGNSRKLSVALTGGQRPEGGPRVLTRPTDA